MIDDVDGDGVVVDDDNDDDGNKFGLGLKTKHYLIIPFP
jgi:hypothetical protein